jgi:hypothetical protein
MATDNREICNQIITLMKADSAFSTIAGYIIYPHFKLPITRRKRLCEISLETGSEEHNETGYIDRVFNGAADFTILEQDTLTFTSDVAVNEAQELAVTYADAFIALFSQKSKRTLGNLTTTGGAVVQQIIITSPVVYMPAIRNDTYTAISSVPFEVRVKKVWSS